MAGRRKKAAPAAERPPITVQAKLIPLFGIAFENRELRAITAIGRTPADVQRSARGAIANHLRGFDVTVEYVNPESFEKAGITLVNED